ncbi:MAG: ABC transporter ATP-binding protein [Deltaproteobacteria bacterium]|nr:ABC transporter ATP-binding protein [Deltaproteobacteria bacterium]
MITTKDLRAGYDGASVLRDVNLRLARGEFVGLLGPNGGGKTTLVRVLSGVLRPQSGTAHVAGQDIHALSARRRARLCATVPQANPGLGETSVLSVVLMGRYPYLSFLGGYAPADNAAALTAMNAAGCGELAARRASELSGGETQRVLLARALAQGADLLLLDEAAANLDVARSVDLYELLRARNAAGLTIVSVVHDLNLAALYCQRLVFLKQGRIVHDGPTSKIFTEQILSEIYETPLRVAAHPVTGAPQAYLVPRS